MAVTRLKGVKEFLENCRDEANFSELRQKQFDAMLKELQQLKQVSHENGAQMITSLKSMPWTEEMMSSLLAVVTEKVSFVSTRVSLQNWKLLPLYLRDADWLRLTNPGPHGASQTSDRAFVSCLVYTSGWMYSGEQSYRMMCQLHFLFLKI